MANPELEEIIEALELATGALSAIQQRTRLADSTSFTFTGRWSDYGTWTLGDILDRTNALLGSKPSTLKLWRLPADGAHIPAGTLVHKIDGYRYPGIVDCAFLTQGGKLRYVVEATGADYAEMLHIFAPAQIKVA